MAAVATRRYAPRLPPAERREQLLDAALAVIAEEGFGGATLDAVAKRAGVSRPVVYDAFGSLDKLLQSLLEREEQRAFAALAAVMPIPPPADAGPEDILVEGVLAFARTVADNPDPWRVMLLPPEGTPAAVRRHVDRGRQTIAGWMEQLMGWGFEQAGLDDIDRELAALAMVALGESMAQLIVTDSERYPPERMGEFARSIVSRLLAPQA